MIVDKMSAARRRSTASRSSELSDQQRMDIREAFTLFSKESNVIASKDLKVYVRFCRRLLFLFVMFSWFVAGYEGSGVRAPP